MVRPPSARRARPCVCEPPIAPHRSLSLSHPPQFSPSHQKLVSRTTVGQVTYEQDVAWGEDGTGPSARGAGFSKQAARGRFFQLLQKQRRGGARSAGGGRVIGCVLIFAAVARGRGASGPEGAWAKGDVPLFPGPMVCGGPWLPVGPRIGCFCGTPARSRRLPKSSKMFRRAGRPRSPALSLTLPSLHSPHSDALWEHSNQLRIDLQDVVDFDADLGSALEASPAEFLPLVRRRKERERN